MKPEKSRLGFTVGAKVAAMVIISELITLAAYFFLSRLLVNETAFADFTNLRQRDTVTVAVISCFVFAGYLTFLVITRIFSPVSKLTKITEEIIKGNLNLRLDIRTHDELQILAERFNAMADALRNERALLESKVKDRTKELEESQAKELERQREVVKLKDEFLFVAAHELRTPLTAIRWSLESLDAKKMTKEAYRQALDDAMEGSRNLAALVEDLLNMARLESNRIEFKKELVDMRTVVKAVLDEAEPLAKRRKITLESEVPAQKTIDALADERRIREVLINLVGNALKFGREGGKVIVKLDAVRDKVRIDVVDDGPGIAPEEQSRVFEKFWRSKAQSGVEGSGLGLFITKRLVDGMNGTVKFVSQLGQGTTFTVTLPLEPHQLLK
jgi:signal transduction histidine kinase